MIYRRQKGVMAGGDHECTSPPTDLLRYLISLGELLVTWISPLGVGVSLSRRLFASGANWALLRTLGKALRPGPVPKLLCADDLTNEEVEQ